MEFGNIGLSGFVLGFVPHPNLPRYPNMKRKQQKTLETLFARPTSANVRWRDIEALLVELGAEISEREGSRIGVRLFGDRRVFHRPHPTPNADKGQVASIRQWLKENEVTP